VRQSAATIVFSHDTRARVQACFDVLPERLAVVYHGLDWGAAERQLAVDEAALARLGLRQPYLLYVSQFHRYKNLLLLLEAFGQVAARHPELRLALVGDVADAAYWREVEERIAALDLRERVVHVAACERAALLSIYRGALAFVHPSLAETCSFPLLEALALGVPIAAARMSALPEIAGEAAVYFDPYDAGELAAALERLLTVEELRAELSQKAATRAAQFTWAAAAEQTLAVLEAVGGQRQDFQD
jgi:glycosyltransferase involved in cell wall biosynthesis